MRVLILSTLALLAAACAPGPGAVGPEASGIGADDLNAVAEDYVRLILDVGEIEEGYVDAYYGPAEWQAEAKAETETPAELKTRAEDLTRRLEAIAVPASAPAEVARRKAYLLAHVSAAHARLRMIEGEKFSFADEAEALFGVRPDTRPLTSFDPVLARLDAVLPGEGTISQRLAAFRGGTAIPRDRQEAVMRAAIDECRARTEAHIDLPADENFTLEFVTDKPWSGYNWYQGKSQSLIQINVDQPISIERAIDLGCHEGYPGHHVYNMLLEKTFVVEKGWVEMSVYPLYSPMSLIAEGSANYGIDLAFPGETRGQWEAAVLYPLAGLDPRGVELNGAILEIMRELARAEYTIADDWLSGRADRETTIQNLMKYGLHSRASAERRIRFIDAYRSYIINYSLGRDMVQAWVEAQGPDHWTTMETLLGSQILPVDLL
ncbi:MAG: hypothetical protein KJ676_01435 [Alphaproteobacteria bacterium]|nr:hypothetical protein [Alphaproteobacteria bacterium]MBU1526047.1 hypothetical protein [Alphaproteobacteria bacterium]MBU2116213.1 hypothetical protein [Alphaproteobacteria bacterium]MBU2350640.1 hypothetical protein [Alphaproteobacteria bacterium]MBU2382220.1 hypothetical protein [Alphaproteobacteria bacterium]